MARKKAQAFRTITEVSDWLDTPSHVLRFWESKFSQIKPVKRAGGRRYYRPEDLKLIGGIKVLLHDDGNTIASVQDLIKDKGEKHVESFSPDPVFAAKGRRRAKSKAKADKTNAAMPENAMADDSKVEIKRGPVEESVDVLPDTPPEPILLTDPTPAQPPLQMGAPIQKETPLQLDAFAPVESDPLQLNTSSGIEKPAALINPDTAEETTALSKKLDMVDDGSQANRKAKETNARSMIDKSVSKDKPKAGGSDSLSINMDEIRSETHQSGTRLLEIEELYFELQRLRNRMRRNLQSS